MKDETQEHIDKIISLVQSGKKKIILLNNAGEGKTFLINELKKQVKEMKEFEKFNIYDEDSYPIKSPYIMPVVSITSFEDGYVREKPDVIYIPKYSKQYKDYIMGFEMPEGTTFRQYEEKKRKEEIASSRKRNFESIEEYKQYFNQE